MVFRTSKRLRAVSNRSFIFGDFDGDRVRNIDDFKPFDKKVKKFPDRHKNPSYYHRARFGDSEGDVLLGDVLLKTERLNNKRIPILKSFLRHNKGSYGRIKSVPSTLNKLTDRYYGSLRDVAGATIITDDRFWARRVKTKLRKRYKNDAKEYNNYYLSPKDRVYRAYHIGVMGRGGMRLEAQIKSAKRAILQEKIHKAYKRGTSMRRFVKSSDSLFLKGF